jgi:hypothetical protein
MEVVLWIFAFGAGVIVTLAFNPPRSGGRP